MRGPLKERQTAKIFFQICSAVKYLHQKGIVHRDIKTQNIMIDSQFNAKLIDFGLAKDLNTTKDHLLDSLCGSLSYMSPQRLQNKRYDGKMFDVWCLGVSLYVMLEASLPFDHQGQKFIKQNVTELNWEQANFSSNEAKNIYEMIFRKSFDRATVQQIIFSPFFQKYQLEKIKVSDFESDQNILQEVKLNSSAIQKICSWLGKTEKQVKFSIIKKDLSSAHAIYELLRLKGHIKYVNNYIQNLDLNNNNKIYDVSHQSSWTIYQINQKSPNFRPSTPSKIIRKTFLPSIENSSQSKILGKQKQRHKKNVKTLQNIQQEEKNQQIRPINKIKVKNIFSKQLTRNSMKPYKIQNYIKSSRYQIDCINRYN